MNGPYEWIPPSYWLTDTKNGGAWGFATEVGPGPVVPPLESLRQMLPASSLWPIDEQWNFHAGGGQFQNLRVFTEALSGRYGEPKGVEDYAFKAQVMAYEGLRAMFEAYARNKYTSTGVIQWMLNDAWPSMIWHLYDYYLRPGGAYFGTKKACEPIHVQYSYDDRSIVVVNGRYEPLKDVQVTARLYDIDMEERFSRTLSLDAPADSSTRAFVVPEVEGLSRTYFLKLRLQDAKGALASSNFYWLSTQPEVMDWDAPTWYYTPATSYADLTGLEKLPPVELQVSTKFETEGDEGLARVTVENPTPHLAFAVRLRLTRGEEGPEVLPILWQDNYFELLPGETRQIVGRYQVEDLEGAEPFLAVDGWNVTAAPGRATRR
jgi:exo-1,4-beta-D-glucosaminidase